MNANTEPLSPAEECTSHRFNIAALIRERGGLTEEERIQLERYGVRHDPATGLASWTAPPGETNDPATERRYLLNAIHLLLGPPEPITEEELAEALASGKTFEDMLTELGVNLPKDQRAPGE